MLVKVIYIITISLFTVNYKHTKLLELESTIIDISHIIIIINPMK